MGGDHLGDVGAGSKRILKLILRGMRCEIYVHEDN
jgi:hypothetical protein